MVLSKHSTIDSYKSQRQRHNDYIKPFNRRRICALIIWSFRIIAFVVKLHPLRKGDSVSNKIYRFLFHVGIGILYLSKQKLTTIIGQSARRRTLCPFLHLVMNYGIPRNKGNNKWLPLSRMYEFYSFTR